jgi:hypothetical protein
MRRPAAELCVGTHIKAQVTMCGSSQHQTPYIILIQSSESWILFILELR